MQITNNSSGSGVKVNLIKGVSSEALSEALIRINEQELNMIGYNSQTKTYRDEASIFKDNASISATNANNSALLSTTKANEANISANNAKASELLSAQYKADNESIKTNVQTLSNSASDSANTASIKANEASVYATNSNASAINALASENKAEEWASKGYGLEVEPGLYSAKHYAIEASNVTSSVVSVNGMTGDVVLTKSNMELENIDNTSDLNKPISTATQNALNLKVDKITGKGLSTEDFTTSEKTKLSGLSNYTKPTSEPISYITGLQTALDTKVDKVAGKQLSTEDYTTAEKTKLNNIENNANNYTLPTASPTVLGGIKVGTNLSIDANGVLSANDTNVSFTEISNKPTNLSGYGITDAYTKTEVDSLIPDVSTKQDTLVSATNIKTINGESILGSGDIVISGGGAVDLSEYYKKTETYSKIEVDTMIGDIASALDTINGEVI